MSAWTGAVTIQLMEIPVYSPFIKRKEMNSVLECLVSDAIGPGEYLVKFLKTSQEHLLFDYGIAVRSPWLALKLALDALGLSLGSYVAISALAPFYHYDVLVSMSLIPVLYDHDIDSLEPLFNDMRIKKVSFSAIILYDAIGILPSMDIIEESGIPIIEDMSSAFGAEREQVHAGQYGVFSIFNLENDSILPSGGGSILFSSGKRGGQILKNMQESLRAEILMTDLNAALGYARARDLVKSIQKRKELLRLFSQSLARSSHRLPKRNYDGEVSCHAFSILCEGSVKDVQAYAQRKDINTELAFMKCIISVKPEMSETCPNARSIALRTLNFPLHQRIGSEDAIRISRVLSTLP